MAKIKDKWIDFGTGSEQVNASDIPANRTATNYTPTDSTIKGHLDGIDTELASVTSDFSDSVFRVSDNGDSTKKLEFEVSGVTTATTRTLTVPNANTTIVGTDATQTLTNKTIDADSNTITNIENADIKASAGIVRSKLATQYLNRVAGSTSAPTTTSVSFVQIPEMTRTFTPTFQADYQFAFQITTRNNTAGQNVDFTFVVDGTPMYSGNAYTVTTAVNNYWNISTLVDYYNLTAVSHTIEVHWRVTGGTATAQGVSRAFTVSEVA